jgi:glycosyltransferase involved in cell wall biosynthesis
MMGVRKKIMILRSGNNEMAKPIKILYIIDELNDKRGGTENQLIKLLHGLNKEKFQAHLLRFQTRPRSEINSSILQCDESVINIYKFNRISTYINFIKLIKFIREYKPHVVHTFFPAGNILGVIAAKLACVKNTVSSRRDYGEWMNRRYLIATRIANIFVTKIVANSYSVKKLTEEREHTRNGQVEVILNGINATKFYNIRKDTDLKARLNIPEHDKVVGIVANFSPVKHHSTFLKAAGEIAAVRKDVSFILVGAGQMRSELKSLGASLNIAHKLVFTGAQDDVIPYLSIMDVGINCSVREGLSNAIMEYMAAGIPCVVSNAPGNIDLITHDENGYIFEIDDYTMLAKHILGLFDDAATRQKFIKNARRKIEYEMSLEAMLSRFEHFYHSMVKL